MAPQLWEICASQLGGISWKAVAKDASFAAVAGLSARLLTAQILLEVHAKRAQAQAKQVQEKAAFSVRSVLALGLWLVSPLVGFFSVPLAMAVIGIAVTCGDVHWHGMAALSGAYLAALALLVALPLNIQPPAGVQQMLRWTITTGMRYFPATLTFEDRDAFEPGQPYVLAYEPHSILPWGMMLFSRTSSAAVPAAIASARILMSTACFWVPVNRNLWWWMGCRPASKSGMRRLLAKGSSVVLCPGGVRECIYMQPGSEHAFLRSRRGFVRLALEAGAPLVPVFAFGQSDQFSYVRLGIDWPYLIPRSWAVRISRAMGFLPLLACGVWGTCMPRRVPMHVVVGRPIAMPKDPNPSDEMVERYLSAYIDALQVLFDSHKATAGHPHERLTIH